MRTFLLSFICCVSATFCAAQAAFLDPTFGSGGKTIIPLGPTDGGAFENVSVQPDGKIVVAGTMVGYSRIFRFNTNGTLDSTFSLNGIYTGSNSTGFLALTLQPDDKIVAEGRIIIAVGNIQFLTIRLNSDGTPDMTFGSSGIVTTDFGPFSNDYGKAIAMQADGRIVLAGEVASKPAVARLLPTGVLDSSFDADGLAVYGEGGTNSVAIAPDGKIVLGGIFAPGEPLLTIRILPNGALDTSFNHTGKAMTLAGDSWNNGGITRVQPDGKIVVAGSGTFGAQGSDYVAIRYNTDGTLDGSFGFGGIAHVDFNNKGDRARAMVLTTDGKILLAGEATVGDKEDFAVVRLNSDGTPDPTFGDNGRIVNAVRSLNDQPHALALQADGRIVLAGSSVKSNPYVDPAIVRFLPAAASVDEIGRPTDIILYPNPLHSILMVDEHYLGHIVSISATDIVGRVRTVEPATEIAINLANWPVGVYFFRVALDDGRVVMQRVLIENSCCG